MSGFSIDFLSTSIISVIIMMSCVQSKDFRSNHHTEEIKPTDTSDEAGRLTLNQVPNPLFLAPCTV